MLKWRVFVSSVKSFRKPSEVVSLFAMVPQKKIIHAWSANSYIPKVNTERYSMAGCLNFSRSSSICTDLKVA